MKFHYWAQSLFGSFGLCDIWSRLSNIQYELWSLPENQYCALTLSHYKMSHQSRSKAWRICCVLDRLIFLALHSTFELPSGLLSCPFFAFLHYLSRNHQIFVLARVKWLCAVWTKNKEMTHFLILSHCRVFQLIMWVSLLPAMFTSSDRRRQHESLPGTNLSVQMR